MEHIHGVDVSWMTHGNPKDKATKTAAAARQRSWSQTSRDATPPAPAPTSSSPAPSAVPNGDHTESPTSNPNTTPVPTAPKPIPGSRPGFTRHSSAEEKKTGSPASSPSRRGSWFSNISSKFSSSGGNANQSPPQASNASPKPAELSVPKANPVKNAVLQHASRHEGEGPYTPAPPRSSQAGILHVFRRLSASNGTLSPNQKANNHGLVARRVLNVDRNRERCDISGLNQAKLRRVAFCVDVEIAPMPKYADGDATAKKPCEKSDKDKAEKTQKKKIVERGEGDALKQAKPIESLEEQDSQPQGKSAAEGTCDPTKAAPAGAEAESPSPNLSPDSQPAESTPDSGADKSCDRKKEKKKKSEEERKARKEKKRKLAEANGTIPMEIHLDSDESESTSPTTADAPKVQAVPTTNPVRIYRRCCQLRETPILKKITEQLTNTANFSAETGVVEKLDLTGYWMQLADLVTLGDYLAVVPVKEVILENCGLTDEGLRVVLAGLLAVNKVDAKKRKTHGDILAHQGGLVERLVLKNNKIGPEGWRHVCLFIYLCRTLKNLDLSTIPFPKPVANGTQAANQPVDICTLLSKSLGERLAGSTLSLVNVGETNLNNDQLGRVIDGVIKCGVKRLGLAHNNIDAKGMQFVAKFLANGGEALDLAGNNLREQMPVIAEVLNGDHPLWALSLAECNLDPSSLCKLFPSLVALKSFRFIDLSHNPELFNAEPSAVKLLRRYLPLFTELKRIHLTDCSLNSSQAIAICEILPEVPSLAHFSLLENPELQALTNATTEETQEEAVALFASLLAATRVSTTLVAVDIEVPSEQSSDLVKAMARQVVAYCLRNMERVPLNELAAAAMAQTEEAARIDPEYPVVLQHLVGHDVMSPSTLDADVDEAPDDDYVIGGTGVVKALACCLDNRGDESRRQSRDFSLGNEGGLPIPQRKNTGGKAKETSKHLLLSARKIRDRLQPAIAKARRASAQNTHAFNRLIFLDNTLNGIIKRFEDEFPDTRESIDSGIAMSSGMKLGSSVSSTEAELYPTTTISDDGEVEDEGEADFSIKSPSLSRTNSVMSTTSKALANEEARVLRAGHKFRLGIVKPEHWKLVTGIQMVAANPRHIRMLHELIDELGRDDLAKEAEEKGIEAVFQEHREELLRTMKETDPEHWERFAESQEMTRANLTLESGVAKSLVTATAEAVAQGKEENGEDSIAVVD
ncbi:hypothetical protein GQ53DRAFT_821933 [Thozetella sp. PMI_491]|nr:hypothetical protein GQ53DRAFT_821933 [Thozetella sp. PMI_491]